jgi:transcriptional regulator GlxA family with amidase domain
MKRVSQQRNQNTGRVRRIGFLVFPDCEVLDVLGPFETFFFAHHWLTRLGRSGEPGYDPVVIADVPGTIRTMSGVEIVATHGYSEIAASLDTLVVAGGIGVDRASEDQAIIEWVRSTASRARRVASICVGSHFGLRMRHQENQ